MLSRPPALVSSSITVLSLECFDRSYQQRAIAEALSHCYDSAVGLLLAGGVWKFHRGVVM